MIVVDVQALGLLDQKIRDLDPYEEEPLLPPGPVDPYFTAISRLWILSTYEILRSARQLLQFQESESDSAENRWENLRLAPVFSDVEALRMPLAKYEITRRKGVYIVPRFGLDDAGDMMWEIPIDGGQSMQWVSRRDIADRLLQTLESARS